MSLAQWRDVVEHYGDVTAEPGEVDYAEVDAAGLRALWAVPAESRGQVPLCLHGAGLTPRS